MHVAIISDIHDNVPNLEKALKWMNKNDIEQIIFCGDLCSPLTLAKVLAPKFSGPIHMVFGNIEDREMLPQKIAEFSHVKHYEDLGEIELDGKKIAFVHYPNKAKELAEGGKFDIVFYGHNHKPWDEKIGNTRMLNPGTLGGLFQKATFAVWDTESGELELKIVEKLPLTP